MIKIDDVYQKVLAIANKEQRGYVTPQEFNLFSDQAQLDIFEQYIYDINQFERVKGNDTEYSDMLEHLNEKLSAFKHLENLTYTTDYFELADDTYRIGSIIYKDIQVQEINDKEFIYLNSSPLLRPTEKNPIYIKRQNKIFLYPQNIQTDISCSFIKKPIKPRWNYVVVNGEALYNPTNSENYQLHISEENNLINKILQLAGITMNNEIYQVASQEEIKDIQQEKA
tara:strand:- start:15309 stop:15986 length:678 start_codon:yes stop_codon:yes gene_type:complete